MMPEDEKIHTQLRLAAALKKILDRNKEKVEEYAITDKDPFWIVDSIRHVEASSRLSYTIVQGVFSAKRDLYFTSLVTMVREGLGLSFSDFAKVFDSVTDQEIADVKKHIAAAARSR